jgi:DNA replication and repair protein RecF
LVLDQFRSYERLELELAPGTTLVAGDNASGKSNLLEAMYMLAATRSPRASTEGELLAWSAPEPAVTRLEGRGQRGDGVVTVEIALSARTDAQGGTVLAKSGAPLTSKRLRLNGIARRASDVVGQIAAVLFSTLDIEIMSGSPAVRRRYLDLMVTQYLRTYAVSYGRYDRAVTQRNAVLKRVATREATVAELEPWNDVLIEEGAVIVAARAAAVQALDRSAREHHQSMAAEDVVSDGLVLRYEPALGEAGLPEVASASVVTERLRAALSVQQGREIAAGRTLVGPHRDEVAVLLNGRSVAAYASRAQQRSVALAMRLAEADVIRAETGEYPVLLLDDLFSELDPARREATARAIGDADQVVITTADRAAVPASLLEEVRSYTVASSELTPEGTPG